MCSDLQLVFKYNFTTYFVTTIKLCDKYVDVNLVDHECMQVLFEGDHDSMLFFTKIRPIMYVDMKMIQKKVEEEKAHVNKCGLKHVYETTSIGVFENLYRKNLEEMHLCQD
jgi:hypothetical protein